MKTKVKTYEKPLNPEDAPPGYFAAPQQDPKEGCPGCAFEKNEKCGMDLHCCASEREDRQPCIFLKK